MLPDPLVDGLDLLRLLPPLRQNFAPLLVSEQADTETAAAPVGPAFVFHDFVAVLIPIDFTDIRVGDEFVEHAVSDAADAAVAVNQDFRLEPQLVGFAFEPGQFGRGVDFCGTHQLSGPVGLKPGHVLLGLDVGAHAGVNNHLRETLVNLLNHRRGLDDHPFDAEVGVLFHLFHYQGYFFRRDFRVQGYPDLPLVIGGNVNRFPDLAVFQFPGALPAAEALGPNINGIGAAPKNRLHHFQAAARS